MEMEKVFLPFLRMGRRQTFKYVHWNQLAKNSSSNIVLQVKKEADWGTQLLLLWLLQNLLYWVTDDKRAGVLSSKLLGVS